MELWVVRVRESQRSIWYFTPPVYSRVWLSVWRAWEMFCARADSVRSFQRIFLPFFPFLFLMVTHTIRTCTLAEHKSLFNIYPEGIISICGNKLPSINFLFHEHGICFVFFTLVDRYYHIFTESIIAVKLLDLNKWSQVTYVRRIVYIILVFSKEFYLRMLKVGMLR
jgi:hypothetical protein